MEELKIIQIACCGHENTINTQSETTLFALTSTGSIYSLQNNSNEWVKVPAIVPGKTTLC